MDLVKLRLQSYIEHLNIHIYKTFREGAGALPYEERYFFPNGLSADICEKILKGSEFFKFLCDVYLVVHFDEETESIVYRRPLGAMYDKIMITIGKYAEKNIQIMDVLDHIKSEEKIHFERAN